MENIMDVTDEEREEAQLFCAKIYKEDKELLKRAYELQSKLALGGLWKGTDNALAEIIKAFQKEQGQ